jgi:hypothetical protein
MKALYTIELDTTLDPSALAEGSVIRDSQTKKTNQEYEVIQ